MRVRMEPVRSGPIDDLEFIDLDLSRTNRLHWMSIAILWHAETMWVNHAVFSQIIMEIDSQLCARFRANDRAQVIPWQILYSHAGAAQQLTFITPDACLRARKYLN